MPMQTVEVATRDGVCPVHFHRPDVDGRWPAVVLFLDASGIRPALHEMADRLARHGYVVLLPDLFYRGGRYEPQDPAVLRANPELREAHRERFVKTVTNSNLISDMEALFVAMDASPHVRPGPVGVTGYCLGGRLSLVTAATFPDRVAVAASYHGGNLATDKPASPHLLVDAIKAKVYVAGAIDDPNFPDDMKARLEAALTKAGLDFVVETYPAKHGWVMRDNPVYDAAETEHHWRTLIPLLDGVLKA